MEDTIHTVPNESYDYFKEVTEALSIHLPKHKSTLYVALTLCDDGSTWLNYVKRDTDWCSNPQCRIVQMDLKEKAVGRLKEIVTIRCI